VKYYRADHVEEFWEAFEDIPADASIVNLGCGRATSLLNWPNSIGIDFNPSLKDVWRKVGVADQCIVQDAAETHPLARSDQCHDWTVSADFLEHVGPEQVDDVLGQIARLAPHGRHLIHLAPESGWRGPGGENLHPSANNQDWWVRRFGLAGIPANFVYPVQFAAHPDLREEWLLVLW